MKEISCVHSVESVYIRRGISFTFIYKNILAGQVNANYFSMKSVPRFVFFFLLSNFYQSKVIRLLFDG